MATMKLRVEADPVTISVESEHYRDAYLEGCEEDGITPESEVPAEFVRAQVQEELETGGRDLSETLEQATVSVTLA